ncbi:MAG: hypothetical protein ABSG03_25800 [Bryobacteraceae bacterium]
MIALRGYRFALRSGMDNITNQSNPTAVNNVSGAPGFLQLLGFWAMKGATSWCASAFSGGRRSGSRSKSSLSGR